MTRSSRWPSCAGNIVPDSCGVCRLSLNNRLFLFDRSLSGDILVYIMAKQTVLTKEYFEQYLDKRLDQRFKENTKEIKLHVSKEIGDLAAMQAREFRRVDEKFDKVYEHMDRIDRKLDKVVVLATNHEKRIARVERAVGIPETI